MNWRVPTIAGIQSVAAMLTIIGVALLFALVSRAAAIGFLAGGVLMIVNLYLLTLFGKSLVALAQDGAAGKIGAALAPLKLTLFVVVAYLLISRLRVDLPGFALGVLTQFAAIFIETGRVSRRTTAGPEVQQV
jgi:hypothetical protein